MNKKNIGLIASSIIILIALSRLLPHPFNFTPVGAMALFGGKFLVSRYAKFLVPLIGLYLSDFIINNFVFRSFFPNHEGLVFFSDFMLWTYSGVAIIVLMGYLFLKKFNIKNLLLVTLSFSIVFFLITNFGTWVSGTMYPKTASGLVTCMMAGIPYFKWTLLGNLVYTPILFFSFEYFLSKNLKAVKA